MICLTPHSADVLSPRGMLSERFFRAAGRSAPRYQSAGCIACLRLSPSGGDRLQLCCLAQHPKRAQREESKMHRRSMPRVAVYCSGISPCPRRRQARRQATKRVPAPGARRRGRVARRSQTRVPLSGRARASAASARDEMLQNTPGRTPRLCEQLNRQVGGPHSFCHVCHSLRGRDTRTCSRNLAAW
jgi:hypothetical protein